MTTMIERVARAICEALIVDPKSDAWVSADDGLDDVVIDGRVNLVAAVRAAIEAMREPTKDMIDAAYDAHDAYEAAPVNKAWCGLWSAWHAMIDAALKEE